MRNEPEAEPPCDLGLQRLDLLRAELDDVSGRQIDEMIVVLSRNLLVPGSPIPEIEALDDALGLEELDGPVNRRKRDSVIDGGGATVELNHVWMVLGLGKDARDDP